MKKSDWALIVLIVAVVGVVAYLAINAIVGNPEDNPQKVETAPVIVSEVTEPSEAIFHEDAINPTVKVRIGEQAGQDQQQIFSLGRQ